MGPSNPMSSVILVTIFLILVFSVWVFRPTAKVSEFSFWLCGVDHSSLLLIPNCLGDIYRSFNVFVCWAIVCYRLCWRLLLFICLRYWLLTFWYLKLRLLGLLSFGPLLVTFILSRFFVLYECLDWRG